MKTIPIYINVLQKLPLNLIVVVGFGQKIPKLTVNFTGFTSDFPLMRYTLAPLAEDENKVKYVPSSSEPSFHFLFNWHKTHYRLLAQSKESTCWIKHIVYFTIM